MYRVSNFVQSFAWALIAGAFIATVWVNAFPQQYYDLIEWHLPVVSTFGLFGELNPTFRDLVANLLMALFVFYLGKELWEAFRMDRGALVGRQAGLPVLGAIGGILGAAITWMALSATFQTAEEADTFTGWAVPLGSDVVLCYLFARAIFGPGSRAVHVLLLLTILMDILGLFLLGFVNPHAGLTLFWLILPVVSAVGVWWFYGRHLRQGGDERARRRAMHLWPYIVAGVLSWIGTAAAGLPPALGLLPILPTIPHADSAFGMFAEAEEYLTDPLNRIVHAIVRPLVVIMFLFGVTHGGIDLAAWDVTSFIALAAVWLGKPLGIMIGALIVAPALGFRLPPRMRRRDIGLIAILAGVSFTVPALTLGTALPGGAMQEAARLGLAISLLAGPAAILLARRFGQKKKL